MRTPFGLAATIARFKLVQVARGKRSAQPLQRLNVRFGPGKLTARASDSSAVWVNAPETNPAFLSTKSPVLWLTGPEELLRFSATPGLTRILQDSRRTVFLETDGLQLRQRIHEFRPDARLYLTVRFYGPAKTHDTRSQKERTFAGAIEGIRTAQLSGFLICGHVVVEADTDISEIRELMEYLRSLEIDGVVVTSAGSDSDSGHTKLQKSREMIGSPWWAYFSELAQRALCPVEQSKSSLTAAQEAASPGEAATQ